MRKSWLFPGDNDEPYVSQRAGAYQPQSEKRRRWTKRLVILALILCVLYPFVEPYTLRTTQTAITCEDLPASIGQLRIVYVSDIHYGAQMFSDARLSSLINRINALNADIVLLGGDYARDKWSAAAFSRICRGAFRATTGCTPLWANATAARWRRTRSHPHCGTKCPKRG